MLRPKPTPKQIVVETAKQQGSNLVGCFTRPFHSLAGVSVVTQLDKSNIEVMVK